MENGLEKAVVKKVANLQQRAPNTLTQLQKFGYGITFLLYRQSHSLV
jgi:hypothetical protein